MFTIQSVTSVFFPFK